LEVAVGKIRLKINNGEIV